MIDNFIIGAKVVFQVKTMLALTLGVSWGILGGALPGISGSIAMALLLPLTFGMNPAIAIMMLSGVYIGAMYGGSIPAILIRTPGTPASAITVVDGYELHKQGKGAKALGVSLITGFIGGIVSVFILILFSIPLSKFALLFGPPEYFGLGVFGLALISSFSGKEQIKGLISGVLGLILATIGMDPFSGTPRYIFGTVSLLGGVEIVAVMIGLFAVSEIFVQIAELEAWDKIKGKVSTDMPTWNELKFLTRSIIIGIIMGTIEGLLPGGGGAIAAFISYNEAKRWSKEPEKFGKGAMEGVAAPETANNVVTGTALIPLLTFGIPGSNAAAVLLGAMNLHGLLPGPMLFDKNVDVVYGLFVGMVVANVLMFVIGYIALKPCIYIVNISKPLLMASILGLVIVGAFSIENNIFDVWIVLGSGIIGYIMRRYNFNILAMVLGLVLGFMVEVNLRRSLLISYGNPAVFFTRPISFAFIIFAIITLVFPIIREKRDKMRKKL